MKRITLRSALAVGALLVLAASSSFGQDPFMGNEENGRPEAVISAIRDAFRGSYIGNGNYTANEACERIDAGLCDLVSFGRPFISNPDLPERFRRGARLNDWDMATFYGGDGHGYTDYPALD